MKYLILSSDPTMLTWKSLPAKVKKITAALNKTKNATWEVEVRYQGEIEPEVKNGRITHAWYDTLSKPLFLQGNEFLFLQFSKTDWTRLSLQNTLRGANQRDTDVVGESYGWADENTKRKDTKENQFVQVVLHEISHEIAHNIGVLDNTHTYHDANPDISGIFASYDMALWHPKYQAEKGIRAMLRKVLIEIVKRLQIQQLQERLAKEKVSKPTDLLPLVKRKADDIIAAMAKLGHQIRIVEGYRSMERQTELYNQGRTTKGNIVTNAKAGESWHNYGTAVDFVFRKEGYNATNKQWQILGDVGKAHGFEWGGDWTGFVDRPHFEMRLGYILKDFQDGKVDYKKFN